MESGRGKGTTNRGCIMQKKAIENYINDGMENVLSF